MFSVPAYDPLAQFGRSFGSGIGGALNNQADYMRDRGRLQTGLGQLGDVARDQNGNINPLDLYIKMQSALAGIPGGQQNISESFPLLHKMLSQQAAFGSPAAEGPPGLPSFGSPTPGKASITNGSPAPVNQSQPQTVNPLEPYGLPPPTGKLLPSTAVAQRGGNPLPIYSPEDIARINAEAIRRNLDRDTRQDINNLMSTFNSNVREGRSDDQFEMQMKQAEIASKANSEDRWEDYLKKRSAGLDENEYQQKLRLSKQFENDQDIDSRYRKTESAFKNLQNNLDSFRLNTERGLFSALENLPERKKAIQSEAKELVKAGFGDEVTKILQQNGYGRAEEYDLINPLSRGDRDMVEASIGKQYRQRDADIKYLPDDPRFDEQLQKNIKVQEAQKNRLASTLAKNVKEGRIGKGGEFIPGTNLYLLREEAMKRGMSWEDFRDSLNKAIEKGLKLDDEQQKQNAEMNGPPKITISQFFRGVR